MADSPFDLSMFDPSTLDLSHLHPAEQERIRNRQFNTQELSLLFSRQNPWTKSGKPKPLPSMEPQPQLPTPEKDVLKATRPLQNVRRDLAKVFDSEDKRRSESKREHQEFIERSHPPERKTSKATQTTGQKFRKLVEGLFGVLAVIVGTQVPSALLSLFLLAAGWFLLTVLVWDLNLFNSQSKFVQRFFNVSLTIILGSGLFIAWRISRPVPAPVPVTRAELHQELQEFQKPVPQAMPTPNATPSASPVARRHIHQRRNKRTPPPDDGADILLGRKKRS